jgi:hypothetical protein
MFNDKEVGNPKSAPAGNSKGTETDSRAKFGRKL